jgi:peroxiredoxin
MNRKRIVMAAMVALAFSAYAAQIGNQAPDFHGTDSAGKTESLDQYRGKFVVLEWHNHDCPYTIKHYASGNMQSLQKQWTAKGVVWFTVISSAPGQQGYVDAKQENAYLRKMGAQPTAVILDPQGDIGHLYDAKTTPNMYVIDPSGKLIYAGAIDDHPTT